MDDDNDEDDAQTPATREQILECRNAVVGLRAELFCEEEKTELLRTAWADELDGFLSESEEFLAAVESGSLEDFDAAGFLDRLMDFCRKADGVLSVLLEAEEIEDRVTQEVGEGTNR